MSETTIPKPDPDGTETPDWDEEYLDRVSDRLQFNYDLAKDVRLASHEFDLYARMDLHNEKHFLHPALSFGHHELHEHLFAARRSRVSVADFEELVAFGHDLSESWIETSEEHYSTDFTFAIVAPEVPDDVASFVSSFEERTLLKYGYNGHYEINLVAVAPDREEVVGSPQAGIDEAFDLWASEPGDSPGVFTRLKHRFTG